MNRRTIPFLGWVVVLLCTSIVVSGFDLDVDYLEGSLEYRNDMDAWISVDIGDSIPDGRTVRLSDRGFVELSSDGRTVTLTKDGLYETAQLFGGVESQRQSLRQILGTKFSSLLNRDPSGGMTVAAVRGASTRGDDFISWEDESTDYLASGIALYNEEDFGGAMELFKKGMTWEVGAVQRECTFRYALSQQALGDLRGARQLLSNLRPEPEDVYIGEYTVTMATLYLESMEYAEADAVLASYLEDSPRGDAAQAAWLLSAISLNGQGNSPGSQASLQKAIGLGPKTDIGRAANSMLN